MVSPAAKAAPEKPVPESQIAAMLESRYGDGLVYLPRRLAESLLEHAKQRGFVDPDGYLTRKGRALIARYHFA